MVDGCIFCQIVAGEAPSRKLFEDDLVVAILDIFPWTRGHSLIITKEHAATIYELSQRSAEAVITAALRIAPALKESLQADGLNLFQSNGRAAWQTVDHFHLHLLPRYVNDGLTPPGAPSQAPETELEETLQLVRKSLAG